MKERIAKLIDLKSIITLALVGVFCFEVIRGNASIELLKEVLLLVITFYFAKKGGNENA